MIGLISDQHRIIEIATRVIDSEPNLRAGGPVIVVHQHEHELAKMDGGNVRKLGQSGFTACVRASMICEAEADALIIEY